jgi:hypothetical protein
VLLFAATFQWLQVSAKLFQANLAGVGVGQLGMFTTSVDQAIWLGLVGIVVLAVGMRLSMRGLTTSREAAAGDEASFVAPRSAFYLYLAATVLGTVLQSSAYVIDGLAQILLAASNIRWIGFFLLAYTVFRNRAGMMYFVVAFGFEFISGIGFFSGFKTVIFVALLTYFAVHYEIKAGSVLYGLALLFALLVFGSAWTIVKPEFRAVLNEGSDTQSVRVDRNEVLGTLLDMVSGLTTADILDGIDPLFSRIAYVDFFGATIDYIPAYREHTGGLIWKTTLLHVLTPRILFPDKPILSSDSELTKEFTGMYMASDEEGTSISIGYMGESYADFGVSGMFVPVLLIGMLWGFIYRWFTQRAHYAIIGYAFATAALLGAYQFEMASIKMLGGTIMIFIVLSLILRFGEGYIAARLGIDQLDTDDEEDAGAQVLGRDFASAV